MPRVAAATEDACTHTQNRKKRKSKNKRTENTSKKS